ncbi:diguanylate cyclase [Xanthobacter sp. 91]|uniref:diguanylate cyclase n=1 Tax=Xanthobacter sp. 91 TaxID=1117244 RepID=UPI00068DE112|nr:diguanylate cyclase [Xanthobacter sp. 91]
MTGRHYDFFADLLDGMDMGLCLFDADDRCLLWNNTFLKFFPEHDGHVHVGEPYEANLRRFYAARLDASELANIERYIRDGVLRHRTQSRAFVFDHRGRRLRVNALTDSDGNRVRIWQALVQEPAESERSDAQRGFSIDLLDHIPDGAMVLDQNDLIIAANDEFRRLYGVRPSETVVGQPFAAVVRRAWAAAGRPDEQLEPGLLDNMRFAGSPFEIELPRDQWRRVIARRTSDGIGYFTHSDISLLKRQQADLLVAERRAWEGERRYRLLAENSTDVIAAISGDRTIRFMSPACSRILGWGPSEMLDRDVIDFLHPDEQPMFLAALCAGEGSGLGRSAAFVCRVRARHDDWVWMEASIGAVQETTLDGADIAFICSLRDARERVLAERALKRAHEELALIAGSDPLTGLANRRRFEAIFDEEWHRAGRERLGLCLAMVDIDRFKAVNDTFGHLAGDECLKRVAMVIKANLPPGAGLAARYGGEEFVLLLPNASGGQGQALCERIHNDLKREPWSAVAPGLDAVTVSIGLCIARAPQGASMAGLIRIADEALYRAKSSGRNCTEVQHAV